jgi:hypothetical protein
VEAVFLWGLIDIERFVARDARSLASCLDECAALAFGADPREVAEEGKEILFEEADALCPREFAVVAFCALHRVSIGLCVHSHKLVRSTVENVGWIDGLKFLLKEIERGGVASVRKL